MQLGEATVEREPIVIDMSQIPGEVKGARELASTIRWGKIQLASELITAVALSGGVDDEGHISQQMFAAAETAAEYLQDKQGQPFVLVDVVSEQDEPERKCYIAGWLGVVADTPKPLGLVDAGPVFQAGVAVEGHGVSWNGFWYESDAIGKKYMTDRLSRRVEGVAPLKSRFFSLGDSNFSNPDGKFTTTQHVVAGTDIVPWIGTTFMPKDRYAVYSAIVSGVLMGLETNVLSSIDSLLAEPYVSQAATEQKVLHELKSSLRRYDRDVVNLLAQVAGKKAELSTEMLRIEGELQALGSEIPQTWNTIPRDRVTAPISGPPSTVVRERIETIAERAEQLSAIQRRIFELGR